MKFTRALKSFLTLACLTLLVLYVSGCLTGDKSVSAVYDAQQDRFRFLIVYQNIATQTDQSAADLAWLRKLYGNRDHLIFSPIGSPLTSGDWGHEAYLRISNSLFADVNLSAAAAAGLVSDAPPIPLEDIQILPGRFFVRRRSSLCYFQQIVVPGKSADALLDYVNHRLVATNGSLLLAIDGEILRRLGGAAQMPWADFSKAMTEQSTRSMRNEKSDPKQPATEIDDPFDAQSLQLLRAALADGTLKLARTGDRIHVTAELTAADVAGLTAFIEAFRKSVSNAAAYPARNSRENIAWRDMLNSISLKAADSTHVEASVDVTQLINSFYNPLETPPSGSQPRGKNVQNMVGLIGNLADADANLTVGKIVADFKADRLPAYPPEKSLEPGEGIGKITPTTQPEFQ